jgi:hypothetical protein
MLKLGEEGGRVKDEGDGKREGIQPLSVLGSHHLLP